jgi:hypothetical protein
LYARQNVPQHSRQQFAAYRKKWQENFINKLFIDWQYTVILIGSTQQFVKAEYFNSGTKLQQLALY